MPSARWRLHSSHGDSTPSPKDRKQCAPKAHEHSPANYQGRSKKGQDHGDHRAEAKRDQNKRSCNEHLTGDERGGDY